MNKKYLKSENFIYGVLIPILIIVISLVVFIIFFGEHGYSKESADWANFSTYISPFIMLANLVVFSYFTFKLYIYQKRRDEQQDMLEKPILSFNRLGNRYNIVNVGKGSALNIVLKTNYDSISEKWYDSHLLYSLCSIYSKDLPNTYNTSSMCAIYYDIFGNEYVSYFEKDFLNYIDNTLNPHHSPFLQDLIKKCKFDSLTPARPLVE